MKCKCGLNQDCQASDDPNDWATCYERQIEILKDALRPFAKISLHMDDNTWIEFLSTGEKRSTRIAVEDFRIATKVMEDLK